MRSLGPAVLAIEFSLVTRPSFSVMKHKGSDKVVSPEPRADQALVYMIRQRHWTGSARTTTLFSYRTFDVLQTISPAAAIGVAAIVRVAAIARVSSFTVDRRPALIPR